MEKNIPAFGIILNIRDESKKNLLKSGIQLSKKKNQMRKVVY